MRVLSDVELDEVFEQASGGDCTGFLYYVVTGGQICCSTPTGPVCFNY
jgi:hypothetical protein